MSIPHFGYSPVGNLNAAPKDDCALRAFTIKMTGHIARSSWRGNWTELSLTHVWYSNSRSWMQQDVWHSSFKCMLLAFTKTRADGITKIAFWGWRLAVTRTIHFMCTSLRRLLIFHISSKRCAFLEFDILGEHIRCYPVTICSIQIIIIICLKNSTSIVIVYKS